jgi:hypothetical protein
MTGSNGNQADQTNHGAMQGRDLARDLANGTGNRSILLSLASILIVTLVTLAALELVLRIADFRELRETSTAASLDYEYDPDLGWAPPPGSTGEVVTFRTTHYKHNRLGLRDEEFSPDTKPAIVFLGDSFVWGLDSEADERFSDLLKSRLPDYQIQAAGISGFGTDQEYLLLRKIWPKIKPAVVVLIFCGLNDREDNTRSRYFFNYFKPYFATMPDGSLQLEGQPVPRSHLYYYKNNWLVQNLWLARIATNAYLRVAHPLVTVPDPSEKLVGKIRDFVEGHGAKFMAGIQYRDEAMAAYLEKNRIPFVKLEGADYIKDFKENVWGAHWTPEGQQDVAERIHGLLAANGVTGSKPAAGN